MSVPKSPVINVTSTGGTLLVTSKNSLQGQSVNLDVVSLALSAPAAPSVSSAQINASGANPIGVFSSLPPFAANDPSILIDVGIASLNPRHTWSSLPPGFSVVAQAGQVVDDVLGFTPGAAAGNVGGSVQGGSVFTGVSMNQGTVYCRVARAAICTDSSASTSSSFYDSVGNPNASGTYAPTLFCLSDSTESKYVFFGVSAGYTYFRVSNNLSNPAVVLLNPQVLNANIDPTYCDLIVTWQGTQCYIYLDGVLVWNGALSQALSNNYAYIAIGNAILGPSSALGGGLGNFPILRFQLSTAFTPPPVAPILIGWQGDSYVSGSGAGGDGGAPGTATFQSIKAANSMLSMPWAQNAAGNGGQLFTASILNGYILKKYGAYLPMVAACKSGYSWAFSGGYGAPADGANKSVFNGTISGTNLAVNSIASGKPVVGMAIYGTGIAAGTIVTAGAGTAFTVNNSQNVGPVTIVGVMSTTYSDALNASQPQVLIAYGSTNDLYECPNGTGAGLTPVADYLWRFSYMADRNPRLRAIIFVEHISLERFSAAGLIASGCALTLPQMIAVSAQFRAALRAQFMGPIPTKVGVRQVPVFYVPIYENMVASADGPLMLWGSNPNNIQTSGASQGPNGSAPNIHQTPHGMQRYADLIWPTLNYLLSQMSFQDSGANFIAGNANAAPVPNCAQGIAQTFTMNANATVGAPINASQQGQRLVLTFVQDGTGARTIAWNAIYRNAPAWAAGTAGQRAMAEFRYDGVAWQFIGGSSAFA